MASRATSSVATKPGKNLAPSAEQSLAKPSPPASFPSKADHQPAPVTQAMRVVLVDDDPSVHAAMRQTFESLGSGWKLESYLDGNQAISRIAQSPPCAVLMDITMPEITGIECTRKIKALLPKLPVVMFTARTDTESFILSMTAGASGYVVKPSSPAETISAVKKALEGQPALCAQAESTIVQWLHSLGENVLSWGLTPREQQIMLQICSNRPDKDIALLLRIAPATVHGHLHSIFRKLGVAGREEARRMFIGLSR